MRTVFYILVISIFTAIKTNTLQQKDEVKVLWVQNRKLAWKDFKGKNNNSFDSKKAETTTIIMIDTSFYDKNNIPKYKISCYFLPYKSWTITSEEFVLEHEQVHFDIGELYARKIRKSFDSLNRSKEIDFKIYEQIFNYYDIECGKYNELYDSEVYSIEENGRVYFDKAQQVIWIERVSKELEELKKYNPLAR